MTDPLVNKIVKKLIPKEPDEETVLALNGKPQQDVTRVFSVALNERKIMQKMWRLSH